MNTQEAYKVLETCLREGFERNITLTPRIKENCIIGKTDMIIKQNLVYMGMGLKEENKTGDTFVKQCLTSILESIKLIETSAPLTEEQIRYKEAASCAEINNTFNRYAREMLKREQKQTRY